MISAAAYFTVQIHISTERDNSNFMMFSMIVPFFLSTNFKFILIFFFISRGDFFLQNNRARATRALSKSTIILWKIPTEF